MKRLFLFAAIASLMMATGCDNEMDLNTKINNLPAQSAQFLSTSYGTANIVDVDNGREYIEVEIVENGVERDVYFSYDGNWVMTSTDVPVRNLPQEVKDAVTASEYGAWRIDDADFINTPSGDYYLVEVEEPGTDRDVKLKVSADGTSVSVVVSSASGNNLPQALAATLAELGYATWIVDETELVNSPNGTFYLVEVKDPASRQEATVMMSTDGTWLQTSSDVFIRDLPQAVTEAVKASQYGTWRVDDADFINTPSGDYYLVEIEEPGTERELKLKITADGSILA